MDVGFRQLERRAAGGDVEAQSLLVKEAKRRGGWAEPVHFENAGAACGRQKKDPKTQRSVLQLTKRKDLVTCGGCHQTRRFRDLPAHDPRKIHYGKTRWSICGWDSKYFRFKSPTTRKKDVTCEDCKAKLRIR